MDPINIPGNDEKGNRFSPLPYIILIISFTVIFSISAFLPPSSKGHGTHESLGLPPCGFLLITGIPCPSCGLTTSFSHMAHGHFLDAFLVQPFGFVLFLLFGYITVMSGYAVIKKIPFARIMDSRTVEWLQVILLILMMISWVYKIYIMK
jgi:hypothetical protein